MSNMSELLKRLLGKQDKNTEEEPEVKVTLWTWKW